MLKRRCLSFPRLFALFLLTVTTVYADNHVTLSDLLNSIDKLVGYYGDNYHVMNLDGIFGLRAVEGQILLLLEKYAMDPNIATFPSWAHTKLQSIYAHAKIAADLSIQHLKKNSYEYYMQLKYLVDKPFIARSTYRRIDPTLAWDEQEKITVAGGNFTEEFSDSCMALLMGTGNTGQPKCTVTDACARMMFNKGMMDYTITHQLLFTMLAEQNGCLDELNAALRVSGFPGGVEHMRLEFCTNNFFEVASMLMLLRSEAIVPRYQDLFMEQEFVCPALGFMEFLHVDWLAQIIEWQQPSGCYSGMKRKTSFRGIAVGDDTKYEYIDDNTADTDHNAAAAVSTEHLQQAFANVALPIDETAVRLPDVDTTHASLDRSRIGNVDNPEMKRPSIKAGPVGQQGILGKAAATGRQLQWFQEQRGGQLHQVPLHDVPGGAQKPRGFKTRRLLVEQTLPDGCFAHKTAVAAAALSQYLRYMLLPGSPDYQRHTLITGVNYLRNPNNLRSQSLQPGIVAQYVLDRTVRKLTKDDKTKENEIDPDKDYDDGKQLPEINQAEINRGEINRGEINPADGANPLEVIDAESQTPSDFDDLQKQDAYADVNDADKYESREIVLDDVYKTENTVGTPNIGSTSLLKSYVVIVGVMFVVIVSMYKFLRRHRVLIRYRHR